MKSGINPCAILLAFGGFCPALFAGDVPVPPVNVEVITTGAVKIIDPYPTNNKILVGGSSNSTNITAKVTPNDTGTYTWSYTRDLQFAPNGTATAKVTKISTLSTPSPDVKDADKVHVAFASDTGNGNPSDERPLNIVAPEHFAAKAEQPKPIVTQIKLDQVAKAFVLIDIRSDYFIQDKYHETLASDTATFCGNSVQTRESVPWTSPIKIPAPTIQGDWKNNNSGTQTDEIRVAIKGTAITKQGAFDAALVGKDIVTVDPHAWQTKTLNTSTIYTVTNNKLHVVLTSISADGQTATVTASYEVTAL